MSWPTAALGDLCHINIGRTPSRSVPAFWKGGEHPWLSISDMGRTKEIRTTKEGITEAAIDACNMRLVDAGTVLFSFKLSIGKVGIASVPLFTNEAIASLPILDHGTLCEGFLIHALEKVSQKLVGDRAAMGMTLNKASLAEIPIPLPPLEEQRRIAAILDKASSLSSRLACAVQLEDEFNASLFDKLVGDPVVNAKDFPRVRLADLCASADDIKCGPFGTQLKQHEFRSTGVPLWGIKHVNRRFEIATSEFLEEDTARRLSAYSLEPGDIVMTRKGTVGNCSVYPDRLPNGVMHSDLLRIRLDETRCLPSFAAYQLHHSTDIKRQIDLISGGAIMAGINVGRLKEVKIVLPSLGIQKEFESLASRGSWLVWQKNQGMIRRSRELLQSFSGSFFLGSQSGQIKT